jgi:hypothetical protein
MTSETRKKILCHLLGVTFAVIVVLLVGWIANYLTRRVVETTRLAPVPDARSLD